MDKQIKEEIIYTDEEQKDLNRLGGKTKKIRDKLKECRKEKEEYLSQAQRARADLINYRRRQEQILEEFKKYGQINFIRDLLPVMDSLEMGAREYEEIEPIKKQFEIILKQYGVKEIKSLGEIFNPLCHEAVEMVGAKEESGIITEEVQRGYMIGDKIIRVSKVKVAR